MTWRPTKYLLQGKLDNTVQGRVTGWMRFAGMKSKVTFDMKGDCHRDIRGRKISFTHRYFGGREEAEKYMGSFDKRQTGRAGDITAGLPPRDYTEWPYIEWYSDQNDRVVVEPHAADVTVIGPAGRQPAWARAAEPLSTRGVNQLLAETRHEWQPRGKR